MHHKNQSKLPNIMHLQTCKGKKSLINGEIYIKQESESENDDSDSEPITSDSESSNKIREIWLMAADGSFQKIPNQANRKEEMPIPSKKRKKTQESFDISIENAIGNYQVSGKEIATCSKRRRETQRSCVIDGEDVLRNDESDDNTTRNGMAEQNSANESEDKTVQEEQTVSISKIYQILVDIQSSLKDLKAKVAETSWKIDQLQGDLPNFDRYEKVKAEFDFPISTEEQLQEFEKQLQDKEIARNLFSHLTARMYSTWKEMVVVCLKYILSRQVAMKYNLNGRKGNKKKFRDLYICKMIVDCVQYKFREAPTEAILKRISLTLAGATDWEGSRIHKKQLQIKPADKL